jgi:chromosome segregation ATPase
MERRRSLESEKRSHVQKVSNLQRLRVEADAMIEGLKAECKNLKEDNEKKEQSIRDLETEKTTLEGRLAQLEQWSMSQVDEYHSLTDALKSTAFDIAKQSSNVQSCRKSSVEPVKELLMAVAHEPFFCGSAILVGFAFPLVDLLFYLEFA